MTPWIRVIPKKLTGPQLVKKFSPCYRTWRFITAFTIPPPVRIVMQINSFHASPSHFLKFHFNIILPSTSKSLRRFFPSDLPTKTRKHLSSIRVTNHELLIILDLVTQKIFGEEYRSWSSSLCSFLQSSTTSSLLGPSMLLNILFSNILSLRSSFSERD